MCSLVWATYDDILLLLGENNNDTCHVKLFDLSNNKSKITFVLQKICLLLNHILFLYIHLHGYFRIQMVHIIYGKSSSLFLDMSLVSFVE